MGEDPLVGTELEQYRIERPLGKGGMGVVYVARDMALNREVALKLLPPGLFNDSGARKRFQREIESAVRIEHPHVVPVYDAGYDGKHFYIVMRLVDGPDLGGVLEAEGPLPEARALRLLGQLANALHSIHQAGMVHRDVKPQNVLVWASGEADEHGFLTDFGIAKALDDTASVTAGGPVGTPAYMAPEVCGWKPASPASDQYSLGCLAFELLSGRRPFEGEAVDVREAHLAADPALLAECAPGMSPLVCAAVQRALSKEPDRRFATTRDFAGAMQPAREAFRRSEAISETVSGSHDTGELIDALSDGHGLKENTIAEVADLDPAEVVQQRRRAARTRLFGAGPRRNDS
ncbi:MAG: serine/threonine protein kinase [Actinomycetota bacterium]|nr:serine/threonine protein kinase [Actinomycetota bacterium]